MQSRLPTPRCDWAATGARRKTRSSYYAQRLFEFGEQLFSWQLFPEASDLFRYLASRLPGETWPWFWLARCREELGDPLAAATYYETAAGIGERATFCALAARAWLRAGYPERAYRALEQGGILS